MKSHRELLTTTAYFPPARWLRAALEHDYWTLEAQENYQKRGWRNRCRIIGPNGAQLLSVPLQKGAHSQMPITEVRISYERNWVREHQQAIRTAYGNAPYFAYFHEALFDVMMSRPATLWTLNERLLRIMLSQLNAAVKLGASQDFTVAGRPSLPELAEYPQVFTDRHGYVSGLSALDAHFCLGPALATQPLDL